MKCEQKESGIVICNLPNTHIQECRSCKDSDHWRCNNGWCITRSKKGDGIRDCEDGSDERPGNFQSETSAICLLPEEVMITSSDCN